MYSTTKNKSMGEEDVTTTGWRKRRSIANFMRQYLHKEPGKVGETRKKEYTRATTTQSSQRERKKPRGR